MKELNQYIQEKLIVNNTIQGYKYHPKDKDELIDCIEKKINKEGLGIKDNPLDLNDIDTSQVTNMDYLFSANESDKLQNLSNNGYFDISNWDVSNVEDMYSMFFRSNFDGDLSKWNVSKVTNMAHMFNRSKFTGKNGDISKWDISNVKDMDFMFCDSKFSSDISKWNIKNNTGTYYMFYECPIKNLPKWYKK